MRIGKAAGATGVTIRAIRHYESLGLVKPVFLPNGYRHYDETEVDKLRFIKCCQDSGFSLKEIAEVIPTYGRTFPNQAALELVRRKRTFLTAQIAELQARLVLIDDAETQLLRQLKRA